MIAGIDAAYQHECCQPQSETEEHLYQHLLTYGVDVELGISVKQVEDRGDHVEVVLLHSDGREETATARYLIHAGGSHSVVRASMPNKHLEGLTYEGTYIVADVRVGAELPAELANLLVCAKGLVLMAPLPDKRHLIFADAADQDPAARPSVERLCAAVNERAELDLGFHDVRWTSTFRMHKRQAVELAPGSRFLVGDSGHASSPLGGHGLNSALMDAADLAWS